MQTLRIIQELSKDGYLHVRVPQEMGKKFEVIIKPIEGEIKEPTYYMKLQEESGFAKNVLASVAEDVWNEL